jgi:hypothetical protein
MEGIMAKVLAHLQNWLLTPSDLPNIGHMVAATFLTWPLGQPGGSPEYAYYGQLVLPSFSVLASLAAPYVPNDYLYGLYIPEVSQDNEGNVTFPDGLSLTNPDQPGVTGTLDTNVPITAKASNANQVVQLNFTVAFQPASLPGTPGLFPQPMTCQLILATSAQYFGPPKRVTPINR